MELITALSTRVRWHQVVGTIVDHKLAIVLAAVLDGERPDGGVVGQPVAKKFGWIVQPCGALPLNHLRSLAPGARAVQPRGHAGPGRATQGFPNRPAHKSSI